MSAPRSRSSLPVWALVAIVGAGLAWQFWRSGKGEAPERERPAVAAPAQGDAARTIEPLQRADNRRDLSIDERRGGHTLARHVARTDDQLRDRLDRERNISTASTYTDRATAEQIVALALRQNARRVEAWVARNGTRPNLALDYRGSPEAPIGRSLSRGRGTTVICSDALVVLRWHGQDYYVLTSYPEVRR